MTVSKKLFVLSGPVLIQVYSLLGGVKIVVFWMFVFQRFCSDSGVAFGVPFLCKIGKISLLRRLLERLQNGFEKELNLRGSKP